MEIMGYSFIFFKILQMWKKPIRTKMIDADIPLHLKQ